MQTIDALNKIYDEIAKYHMINKVYEVYEKKNADGTVDQFILDYYFKTNDGQYVSRYKADRIPKQNTINDLNTYFVELFNRTDHGENSEDFQFKTSAIGVYNDNNIDLINTVLLLNSGKTSPTIYSKSNTYHVEVFNGMIYIPIDAGSVDLTISTDVDNMVAVREITIPSTTVKVIDILGLNEKTNRTSILERYIIPYNKFMYIYQDMRTQSIQYKFFKNNSKVESVFFDTSKNCISNMIYSSNATKEDINAVSELLKNGKMLTVPISKEHAVSASYKQYSHFNVFDNQIYAINDENPVHYYSLSYSGEALYFANDSVDKSFSTVVFTSKDFIDLNSLNFDLREVLGDE